MKQVEVYRAANTQEAQVLKNVLESEGIRTFISNEGLLGASDLVGWNIDPKVMVGESDAELAMPIIHEFLQQVLDRRNLNIDGSDDEASEPESDWPHCPMCDEPRVAKCTGCQSVGNDFGEAVFVETDSGFGNEHREIEFEIEPQERWLMCTVCDRPFHPVYRKTCRCNYEFEDGIEFGQQPASTQINARALVVLIAIISAIAIGCIYFFRISLP